MSEDPFVSQVDWNEHIHEDPLVAHGIWEYLRKYVPGWGYSKAEIDAFFEGEDAGKKQVDWARITSKPETFPPFAHTLASHSTKPHSALTGVTANQHHAESHTLASHSTKPHSALTGITANQHHAQSHTLVSHTARDHHHLVGLGDDDHTQYLLVSGARTLSGNWDAGSFQIRALKFYSDQATGTAPFTVLSTTLVDNLNVDLWDNQDCPSLESGKFLTNDGAILKWMEMGAGEYHNLLSVAHPDTVAGVCAQGDIITGQPADILTPSTKDAGLGTDDGEDWTGVTNIYASDNVKASVDLADGIASSKILATTFGFSLPSNATVQGIKVSIEKRANTANVKDNSVRIIKGGVISGDQKASTDDWPAADTYKNYGSDTDLWGLGWSYSDINAVNFGVSISVVKASGFAIAKIDHIRITVYYTVPGYGWKKLVKGTDGKILQLVGGYPTWTSTSGTHTHVKSDIIDTPWAWADVSKTGSNLTDLATRQHAGLTNITANQHHAESHTLASHSTKPHSALTGITANQHHNQIHASTHHSGGGDPLAFASIAGFSTYLDQAVKQASSPAFVTAKLTALTDGYVPYHVNDATGLANSPIRLSGTKVGIGISPVAKLHVDATATAWDATTGLAIFQDDGDRQIVIGGMGLFRRDHEGSADLRINYLGYNGGDTQFRDIDIYDGKKNKIASFDGSVPGLGIGKVPTCALDVNGTIKATTFDLNLGGLSDVNLNKYQTAAAYDVLTRDWDGDWCAQEIEAVVKKWPFKSYEIEWEFWTASPPSPWASGAITAGTATAATVAAHHPGSIQVKSAAAANSGYYWIAANNNLILSGKEQTDFVFKTASDWTNRMNRFGFQDSITIALPTDGAYLNMNGRYLSGVTRKAGVQSATGTGYNTSANTWYRGRIIVNSDATLVTFLLYDADENELWTNTLATNIPTNATGFGIVSYLTVAAAGTHTITMDLAYLVCVRGLVR